MSITAVLGIHPRNRVSASSSLVPRKSPERSRTASGKAWRACRQDRMPLRPKTPHRVGLIRGGSFRLSSVHEPPTTPTPNTVRHETRSARQSREAVKMAGKRRARPDPESPESLRGNRLIKPINHLIEKLHSVGTARDAAGNRKLFFDQYATLLLLYFFTPSLDSLRALQEATGRGENPGKNWGSRAPPSARSARPHASSTPPWSNRSSKNWPRRPSPWHAAARPRPSVA